MEINISNFISWFLQQVYFIFVNFYQILDRIIIAPGVSLLEFSVTIIILGFVVSILIAQPGNMMRLEKNAQRNFKFKSRKDEND